MEKVGNLPEQMCDVKKEMETLKKESKRNARNKKCYNGFDGIMSRVDTAERKKSVNLKTCQWKLFKVKWKKKHRICKNCKAIS